jgi:hypothetical protein
MRISFVFNPLVPRQFFFEYFATHVRSMAKLSCVEGIFDWTTASSFLINSLSGWGGMHMAGGGDAQGGEGGCTCILCIPPGYAPGQRPNKKLSLNDAWALGRALPTLCEEIRK